MKKIRLLLVLFLLTGCKGKIENTYIDSAWDRDMYVSYDKSKDVYVCELKKDNKKVEVPASRVKIRFTNNTSAYAELNELSDDSYELIIYDTLK